MGRAILFAAILLASAVASHAADRLALRHTTLDLPGAPSRILATDVDGDGRRDLVVVVAYSEVGRISEDRVEEMISVTTVIPAVFDRREVSVYLADDGGNFGSAAATIDLPLSVLHLETGPPGMPVIALTDEGLSELVLDRDGLRLVPHIVDRPILARSGEFFADLSIVHELNGDGIPDVLLPSATGPAVYLADAAGRLDTAPAHRIAIEPPLRHGRRVTSLRYPVAEVRHVNGDRYPDLVFGELPGSHAPRNVLLGSASGAFAPLRGEPLDCFDRGTGLRLASVADGERPWPSDLVAVEDVDGDGRAEAVTAVAVDRGDGFRQEMKDAKRPQWRYAFHRLDDALAVTNEPYTEATVIGHATDGAGFDFAPSEASRFEDLDGDGRKELITLTLDFSILQVVKILVTKRIGVGLDFHVHAQDGDGSFARVPGLDLSEKLKINLRNLKVGRFAQFAGDFDGDGMQDFVHFGRGRRLTIHRGRPGARYPKGPDLEVELIVEPESLDLVQVEDLDGDGRSDIRVTRPLEAADPDASDPVRVDLYLSGGVR